MQGKQILDHSGETAKTIRHIAIAALGFLTVLVWRVDPGKTYPVTSKSSTTSSASTTSTAPMTSIAPSTSVPSQGETTTSTTQAPTTTQAPVAVSGGS